MAMFSPQVVLNSQAFNYNSATKTMVADASDCRFHCVQPIYDDAADVGIYIRSHRTNKAQAFVLAETVKDNEGDILMWKFQSTDPALGVKVTIFND